LSSGCSRTKVTWDIDANGRGKSPGEESWRPYLAFSTGFQSVLMGLPANMIPRDRLGLLGGGDGKPGEEFMGFVRGFESNAIESVASNAANIHCCVQTLEIRGVDLREANC